MHFGYFILSNFIFSLFLYLTELPAGIDEPDPRRIQIRRLPFARLLAGRLQARSRFIFVAERPAGKTDTVVRQERHPSVRIVDVKTAVSRRVADSKF